MTNSIRAYCIAAISASLSGTVKGRIEPTWTRKVSFRFLYPEEGIRAVIRSFTLPSSVDPGQVSAHYDKGVLKINLTKKAEAKPKQIKVTIGSEKTLEAIAQGKAA